MTGSGLDRSSARISEMSLVDYDEVHSLWSATPGLGLTGADSREAIGRYLERNPGMSFVARLDGALVGAVISGHDGRRGFLHHLAVAERCRGAGIGTELVRRVLAALSAAGMERTHLFVHTTNAVGLRFWARAGCRRRDDIVMFTFMDDDSGPGFRPRAE